MKKALLTIAVICLIILGIYFGIEKTTTNSKVIPPTSIEVNSSKVSTENQTIAITSQNEINKIIQDSYFDILIDIKKYDGTNIQTSEMLSTAMRIAREKELIQSSVDNDFYIEYIDENIIHQIIEELTGIKVKKPINIEEFYYLYDTEKKYYYVVPMGADWIHYDGITKIAKTNDIYEISCTASLVYEGEIAEEYENITIKLKYNPNNTYAKYTLLSIS